MSHEAFGVRAKAIIYLIRFDNIMGVYLQSPVTDKHIHKGDSANLSFVSAEMQGKHAPTKDGEKPWKMPQFVNSTSITATLSLEYLMVMVVSYL